SMSWWGAACRRRGSGGRGDHAASGTGWERGSPWVRSTGHAAPSRRGAGGDTATSPAPRMIGRRGPDDIGISVGYPLPGTVFHEKVKHELVTKANWKDSDDLAMLFRSAHRPEFYKRLHRYVHKRFRRAQAMAACRQLLRASGR